MMQEYKPRGVEKLDIKLAAQIVVYLNLRLSPHVLNTEIVVRMRLSHSSGVTPEELRSAFRKVSALADIEKARLVIDQDELNDGESFRIDFIETGKKE